ncbi:winged helix-turn-helix domain-containing protein [Dyella sp. BiH032]|uniref:winged helix-turn-helix domain-containing protein n=1 Tax=Dyella sp. BiH032 TaxID=3075430 RepID=UPI0028935341|nr:winged helix-turn-helix domain-containing protein [Dyella sp. BiH032]WNL45758.1 winged helix-turn-helix domain-containing protein [Dyella sp. BiH032]
MSDAPSAGERPIRRTLRVGAWIVDPAADQMAQGDTVVRVEARTMRLLLCLAHRAGDVVSIDELLSEVWAGVIVTPDSVYQAITSLRRLLGDDPKQPAYIATVPRRGYRLIASVDTLPEGAASAVQPAPAEAMGPERGGVPKRELGPAVRASLALGILLLLCGAVSAYWWLRDRPADAHAAKSIAVLPFLDLTDAMNEEPFADGMTEELIDKLSADPGLRISAPTSSFYYKNKRVPVADIARSLGVTYVLDGSVRTSGATMRVAARLVRAGDGFVVWSGTYDRPLGDKLKVQDDIAGEAADALKRTLP